MAGSQMLRVAQLNAGSLLEPHWAERRGEIVAWLERLDPDVVCVQEIWQDATGTNAVMWLAEQHRSTAWYWCFGGFRLPETVWPDPTVRFGSAILSRWAIDHHELLALPVDEDTDDPTWRLQTELLHVRTAGVDVFSTHLAPPPAQAYHRVRQVVFIDEAIRARHDPAATPMPPILCGDFNAESLSDEMRFLTSNAVIDGRSTYYQDAWQVAQPPTEPGFTQDPGRNPAYAATHLPPKRIDYVLVGDPFRRPQGAGAVLSAELAFHQPLTGILASDHFGLVVEVRWPQRPPP